MSRFNIPTDDGKSWRWNKLIELCHKENEIKDDASPTIILGWWAIANNLSDNQKTWLSFLYGLTYSTTSAIQVFRVFPTVADAVKGSRLEVMWDTVKKDLYFNRDRKYIKNNNQFCAAIRSFYAAQGSEPYDTIKGADDTQLYNHIVKEWNYFGRHSAFLFFDAYSQLVKGEPNTLSTIQRWSEALTIAKGLACAVYDDVLLWRATNKQLLHEDTDTLNELLAKLCKDTGMPMTELESSICAYYKLFTGTRYLGYYIDRFQEELIHAEKSGYYPEAVADLWQLRREVCDNAYLGELNGWTGIQKHRTKQFLNHGTIIL